MDFEIVTDSSSNLKEEMIDEFGLHILPLTFMVDGEQYQSYLKGEHTDLAQFYTMMREGKVITTSLPSLADSEALMRGLVEAVELLDLFDLGLVHSLPAAVSGTAGRATFAPGADVASLELRHHLLDRPPWHELDHGEGHGEHPEQGGDHEQQSLENVRPHRYHLLPVAHHVDSTQSSAL